MPCHLWKLATACRFGTPKASMINYPRWNIPSTSAKIKRLGGLWALTQLSSLLFSFLFSQSCKVDFPPSRPPPKPQNKRITFEKHLRWRGKNCSWDCFPEAGLVLSKTVKKWGDFEHPVSSVSHCFPTATIPYSVIHLSVNNCLVSYKALQVRAIHVIHDIHQLKLHTKLNIELLGMALSLCGRPQH